MGARREARVLVSVRLDEKTVARLDALAEALPMDLDRSGLLRECLRIGLEAVEADPACLLRTKPAPRKPRRAGGGGPG